MEPLRIALAATLSWTCAGSLAASVPCRVDGPADLKIQIGDRVQTGSRVVADCNGLIALTDHVLVCYWNLAGQPACPRLSANEVFAPGEASGRAPSVFQKVMHLVEGTRQTPRGGLRAAGGERRPGFPYGKVYVGDGALAIAPAYARIDTFVIVAGDRRGAPAFQANNAATPLNIPASALRPGESYSWQARVGSDQFSGGFRVLDRETSEEVARDITAIRNNSALSDVSKQFLQAVVYEYHGLESDAARVAGGLR
jgi:hypothetical protein